MAEVAELGMNSVVLGLVEPWTLFCAKATTECPLAERFLLEPTVGWLVLVLL